MDSISKPKKLYIICFIIQIPSIIITAFAPIIMINNNKSNQSLYCQINPSDRCASEFRKLLPSGYSSNCSGSHGFDILICIFLAAIIGIFFIVYCIIFVKKINNNLKKDNCSIVFFVIFIIFLIFVSIAVIDLMPQGTSVGGYCNNDRVGEGIGRAQTTTAIGIIDIFLILAIIVTTIIKIIILLKSNNDNNNLQEAQLMNQ